MNRSLRSRIIMEAHENALEVMDPDDEGFEELVQQEIDELTVQAEMSYSANFMVYSPPEEDNSLEPSRTKDSNDNSV